MRQIKRDFDEFVDALEEYKNHYGNLEIPVNFTMPNGYNLGHVVSHVRSCNQFCYDEQRTKLKKLGLRLEPNFQQIRMKFSDIVIMLKEYKEEHGNCVVPYNYMMIYKGNIIRLGKITYDCRSGRRKLNLTQRAILEDLGVKFKEKVLLVDSNESTTSIPSQNTKDKGTNEYCVLDYSILNTDTWKANIEGLVKNGVTLLIIEDVFEKLVSLASNDEFGPKVNELFDMILNNDKCFEIEENGGSIGVYLDQIVLNYCLKNASSLITTNKVLALRAKMKKIKVYYIS